MGVVNVTPDSFSDGGRFLDAAAAIAHAARLVDEGADLLDIGAESSRPGAQPLPLDQELRRLEPVVRGCIDLGVPLSIDTYKPAVMQRMVEMGIHMINDIWGFRQPGAFEAALAASRAGVGLVIMHMHRDPRTMQDQPEYADVVADVGTFLAGRVDQFRAAGVDAEQLVIDPGFGFGKTVAHNLAMLRSLSAFTHCGVPVLAGLSRKSSIGAITGRQAPSDRLAGGLAAALIAVQNGATILRVHDVAPTRDALRVWAAVKGSGMPQL